jgi:2-dehydropantoate 2-reductase
MKICIVGAGAIGGYLALRLALARQDVTVIARGSHLTAIQQHGITVVYADGRTQSARVHATDRFDEAGACDLVALAVKAHQISAIASDIPRLFHRSTTVLTLQNGVPWWYFHGTGGALDGRTLQLVDPDSVISRHIDPTRVIHSVVYPAAEVASPGVIHHHEGDRFPVGEPNGEVTERVQNASQALTASGLRAPVLTDTRGEIWLKLIGNVALNPISALTQATVGDICAHRLTRELMSTAMEEAMSIAERLGVQIRLSIDRRIAGTEKLGAHKMSTLQDVQAGRDLEIDAMVGALVELGELTGTPTPCIKTLYACSKLLEKTYRDAHSVVRPQPMPR